MLTQAVRSLLGRFGLSVIRTGPRRPVSGALYSDAEIARLDADLDALNLGDGSYEFFPSRSAVRNYLTKGRINFYHQLVATCRERGVDIADKAVLEVGTGSGYLLRILAGHIAAGSLHGCDYYEELVRLSRGVVPSAVIFQASIDDLRSSSDTYDVIFCTEVIEHILDTETPIPTLLNLLRRGGALVVTVPNAAYDFTPALGSEDQKSFAGHVNFWSEQSWPFYVERMASHRRIATGTLGINVEGDALYAIIFND